MDKNGANKLNVIKRGMGTGVDWVLDHTKIVMPVILIVCVLVTVLIALNANKKEQIEQEAELAAAAVASAQEASTPLAKVAIPDLPLEENAYSEVNKAVKEYYQAMADGDTEVLIQYNTYLADDEIARIRIEEVAKYIEEYKTIDVYTKVGMADGSYVAYVCTEVKFVDMDQLVPGSQTYYVSREEDGSYSINDGTHDSTIYDYIVDVTFQDDALELINKITVAYNDLIDNDEEVADYIAYLTEKIDESVGEILAQAEHTAEEPELAENTAEEPQAEVAAASDAVVTKVRATDVVNIRSSDSETADKLDKAQTGQEFTLLEQKGNGWSKIQYNDREAYIKTEYLEAVESEGILVAGGNTETTAAPEETAQNVKSDGTVTVKESIRVRSQASTDAESLGTVYTGEKLDFVEKQSNGWTKVKYKDKVGFVKSEFVE